MGEKWSVAWRVLDAQFWGVPQRRRRIALIADFGGKSAPEILFVRKSVSGNLEQSRPPRKETAGTSGESSEEPVPCTIKIRGGCAGGGKGALIQKDKSATLSTLQDQTLIQPLPFDTTQITSPQNYSSPNHGDPCHPIASTAHPPAVVYGISSYHSNAMLSDNPDSGVYEADTARTLDSLNCGYPGCNQGGMAIVQAVDARNGTKSDVNGTLQAKGGTSINCKNVVRTETK